MGLEPNNMYPGCEVCKVVDDLDPAFVLIDGGHWIANLRENDQTLLGTSFITLKRHASELDELSQQEEQEFKIIRDGLFKAIRASFAPVTFNFSCLKNNAFRLAPDETPPSASHVHWHLKPRYTSRPIIIEGESFQDPLPGRYLTVFERHQPTRSVALAIAKLIASHLEVSNSEPKR